MTSSVIQWEKNHKIEFLSIIFAVMFLDIYGIFNFKNPFFIILSSIEFLIVMTVLLLFLNKILLGER